MRRSAVVGIVLAALVGACTAAGPLSPPQEPSPKPAPAPETKTPPKDEQVPTSWDDLRFLSRDPENPIRMIGPTDDKTGLFGTRTGQKEYGYLLAAGENGFLSVRVPAHVFYLPEGRPLEESIIFNDNRTDEDFIHEFYYRKIGTTYDFKTNGFCEERRGRFVKVDDKPVEISFGSSVPNIMAIERVRDTADKIVFKKPGKVRLIVRFGGKEIGKIPFEAVPSPVRVGMTNEELLKKLGFPSDEATAYARWPNKTFLNREFRAPTAEQRAVEIKHVRYRAFPELVVSLDSEGRVKGWHSNTEHAEKR